MRRSHTTREQVATILGAARGVTINTGWVGSDVLKDQIAGGRTQRFSNDGVVGLLTPTCSTYFTLTRTGTAGTGQSAQPPTLLAHRLNPAT